jgi:uncharacterized membrane protein YfcA
MSADQYFYAVAIAAVLITGLSKGGFGGGIGMLGTPIMALAIDPVRAAAILLPVLVAMDIVALFSYRARANWAIVRQMMPAALAGTALGYATAAFVPDDAIRVLVGVIAIIFALNQAFADWMKRPAARESAVGAAIWGTLTGYTSFIAHAGGPPYQVYTLPLKLDKVVYAGTAVMFFSILNAVKLVPYFLLGQFSSDNLSVSATLVPAAALGVLMGVWLVKRVSQGVFYTVTYVSMFAIGVKLVYDGLSASL